MGGGIHEGIGNQEDPFQSNDGRYEIQLRHHGKLTCQQMNLPWL